MFCQQMVDNGPVSAEFVFLVIVVRRLEFQFLRITITTGLFCVGGGADKNFMEFVGERDGKGASGLRSNSERGDNQ